MKKTTIILFSCALLLIVAGAVLCFIGTQTGDVFDNTQINDSPVNMEIGENIKTIAINLDEVTVEVYGNQDCERSYIQTVNIDEKFIKNKSSTEMNITDKTDYFDLVLDTVQNFAGLRNLFFREQVNTGAKAVRIFISRKEDVDLTKLKIVARNKGTVKINDMHTKTWYYIEVEEATEYITLNNVDASDITLKVTDGSINLTDCTASHENTSTWSGNGIKADLGSGTFYLTPSEDCVYQYDLSATNGSIKAPNEDLIVKNENVSTYKDGVVSEENNAPVTDSEKDEGSTDGGTSSEKDENAESGKTNDETEEKYNITNVTVSNQNGSIVIQTPTDDPKEAEKTE